MKISTNLVIWTQSYLTRKNRAGPYLNANNYLYYLNSTFIIANRTTMLWMTCSSLKNNSRILDSKTKASGKHSKKRQNRPYCRKKRERQKGLSNYEFRWDFRNNKRSLNSIDKSNKDCKGRDFRGFLMISLNSKTSNAWIS